MRGASMEFNSRSRPDGRYRSWPLLLLSLLAVAATRFLFRSHFLYDLDSVDFALALKHFNPATFQPHPPGYFLYVLAGKLASLIFQDANEALVFVSILASCGAAWMIHLFTTEWYGRRSGFLSLLLFLSSPLCWFHGTVALTYIVEAFFSALIGLLCWKIFTGHAKMVVPASIVFALAAGFRPSFGLLLAPLWLAAVWRTGWSYRFLGLLTVAATTIAWFVPMVYASGGWPAFWEPLTQLWVAVPGRRTVFSDPVIALARVFTIAWILCLCFGAFALFSFGKSEADLSKDRQRFAWLWIGPGLCFFTLVFLLFVNSGYLLVVTPPLFAILAGKVDGFIGRRQAWGWTAAAAGVVTNCVIFISIPLYFSYWSVLAFERDLTTVTREFRTSFDPRDTLIVGFDSHFLGYRHAGYYLPEFITVQYPEVSHRAGKRVFLMTGQDTQVVPEICLSGQKNFVLFPLPEGEDYASYAADIRSRLPQDRLSKVKIGSRDVFLAPVSDLALLFPSAAPKACVASPANPPDAAPHR